jgi:hypothetical protein
MALQEKFTMNADLAASRYTNYLELILAAYNRTILSKQLNARSIKVFKDEVQMLNKHYLEREVDHTLENFEALKNAIADSTKDLTVPVLDDEDWGVYLEDSTNFAFETIKLQSSKDALYAANFLRTKVIELIHMNDFERAYNLVFTSRDLDFFYTDKIGRKVNSIKYIRTMVRDYHVKSYNDLMAGAALINGINEAKVINIDVNHGDHDKTISINSEDTLNYFSIRNEMFHPNTNSILRL